MVSYNNFNYLKSLTSFLKHDMPRKKNIMILNKKIMFIRYSKQTNPK